MITHSHEPPFGIRVCPESSSTVHDLWLDAEDAAWLWKTHADGTGHGSYTMNVLSNAPKLRHINEPTLHEDQHSAGFHVLLPFLLPGKRGLRKSAAQLMQSHSPVCCCQPGYSS